MSDFHEPREGDERRERRTQDELKRLRKEAKRKAKVKKGKR